MPIFILFFLFLTNFLHANQSSESLEFPVLAQGRFRPAEAYARLWLYEFYHAPAIKKGDLSSFKLQNPSALHFLWKLNFLGSSAFLDAPLFWIGSAEEKINLGLHPKQDRWSYQALKNALASRVTSPTHSFETLHQSMTAFEQITGIKNFSTTQQEIMDRLKVLQEKRLAPKQISEILEKEYPLAQRLKHAGVLFKTLPSRNRPGEWLPLNALNVHAYDSKRNALQPVNNFTLYADEQFNRIRKAYFDLEAAFLSSKSQEEILSHQNVLGEVLFQAYQSIAGSVMQEAHGKRLLYPTTKQLIAEALYVKYPWVLYLIFFYGLGAICLLCTFRIKERRLTLFAKGVIFFAIICHSILLGMRSYILNRPPVSNMFETVIYVPWIACLACLFFPTLRKHSLSFLAACFTSIILLVILHVTHLNQNLDQVQAVLDSQFWLLIHVLLVVGSYGIFILGAMLAHFYLILYFIHRKETASMLQLTPMILQTLYGGTTLLISGTILGGIWAAESWGRFWDWDPKESWAFISSCYYLICIHAYRFHQIGSFGLAMGAVGGLLAISFTWYGVNYLLGSGLHSYGFGMGGELYYYAFLIGESLFLAMAFVLYRRDQSRASRLSLEINSPKAHNLSSFLDSKY